MLALLALLYGKIVDLRNRLYDRGVLDTFDLGARTISIGNITTGGTGKTPLVAHVAGLLADRGETVCILTRGYGREEPKKRVLVSDGEILFANAATGGDEPVELAQKLLDKRVIVIADADRVSAAEWAKRKFGVTAFVLDDGFQHRRAKRDVDLVCVDATDPFGGGLMLPAGRLREPLNGLGRADVIVLTRSDLVADISDLRSQILEIGSRTDVFECRTIITGFASSAGSRAEAPTGPAFAFCGLGNPKSFFELLNRENTPLAGTMTFPDHHRYTQKDIDRIVQAATNAGAESLLTTAKDAARIAGLRFEIPYIVVEIEVQIDRPEEFASLM